MPDGGCLTIEGQNASFGQSPADSGAAIARTGEPPTHYVLLSLADTGRGMTEQVTERAFEPFFTTKPAGE